MTPYQSGKEYQFLSNYVGFEPQVRHIFSLVQTSFSLMYALFPLVWASFSLGCATFSCVWGFSIRSKSLYFLLVGAFFPLKWATFPCV